MGNKSTISSSLEDVLIVEANNERANVLFQLLTKLDQAPRHVQRANLVATALQYLAAWSPSVVLLGLTLPDSQALAAYELVAQRAPGVPVILVAEKGEENISSDIVQRGASDYVLADHLTPHELARSIRHAMHTTIVQEALRRSEALETFGQVAGGMAHDFNNLMMIISACGELALGRLNNRDTASTYITRMRDAAMRAAGLTQQLLNFSRRRTLRAQPVCLNRFVTDLIPLLRCIMPRHISIDHAIAADALPIKVDPGQLEQAILNLAVNARDAMPDGGYLTVTVHEGTSNDHGDEPIAVLRVKDTGIGIDHSTMSKIFEPFFTTKPQGRGTGLGLAMVDSFMTQSGGRIHVESRRAGGTIFNLQFPLCSEPLHAFPKCAAEGGTSDS
jgi:two-component system, cell cycle sensor histidine kinase and response regulator CckA